MAKTRGEQVFEEYLTSLGLRFTYEPPIGNRRPDYLVHSPAGDVLCEIKDFEQNDEDRADLEGSRGIPYDRIQLRIRAASSQLREYKGRYPCLVVLFDSTAQVHLIDLTVLGAMYGRGLISVPVRRDGQEHEAEPSLVFERGSRYLTRTSNTTVSGVAVLDYVIPNERMLKDALAQQDFGDGSEGITRTLQFVYDLSEQHPEVFDRAPRLHVFRNVFGAVPWPTAALGGPHDLRWPIEEAAQ